MTIAALTHLGARAARGALLLTTLSAFAFTGSGRASSDYADPAGDNTAAYDIASAAISESADGRMTVVVTPANADRLPEEVRLDLWFDLDNDLRTGDGGDEALVRRSINGQLQFFRWERSDLERRPATGMTMSFEGGVLTFSGPRSAFDDVTSFGLLVIAAGYRTLDGEDAAAFDALPESGRAPYASPGPEQFTDRRGDIPATADITGVRVTDTKKGLVRFAIRTDPSVAQGSEAFEIWIDRDLLGESSLFDRTDVQIAYDEGQAVLLRYSEAEEELVEVKEPSLRVVRSAGGLVVEVHRRALDDVARFGFQVSSTTEDDGDVVARDVAPDGRIWTYRLANRPPLRLVGGELYGTPKQPLAGQPFTIELPVRRSDTGRGIATGRVECTVVASGRRVRAIGSLAKGVATCKLVVPRDALTLRGTMTVRSAGKSLQAWFAGAVEFGGGVDD